ncbi:hypothetical protein B0J11DRAFT_47526 [Dendryphion nanum]|uniref:Uncharacterized protein n=1 Tax=Dendryphion nanum TaxID=256645 RepID=A0A9P9DJR8_9PLEO|nr:hypothetical protein B0J11DRAFT_47526 [Dendryphion nanum]
MSTRFLLSSLILGLAVQSSSAQSCPVNGPLYYDYNLGVCNTAPDDTSFLANIFRQAQEYPVDNVVNVVALYRDSGGVVRRVTGFPQSTFARDGRNEVTFSFPVAISNIPNGAAVTKYLAITDTVKKCTWFGTAAYTQTHIPTITSTVSYTTVTGTSTSTTTSTTTLIETDSTTTTPPTLTATSVTGFKTVWAKRATTVTTSTFTPKPWTKHVVSWTKTTTTVSCLPGPRKRDIDTNSPQPEPRLDRRQGPIYAEPDCDGWFPLQTVYTDTIIVPASTTTTGEFLSHNNHSLSQLTIPLQSTKSPLRQLQQLSQSKHPLRHPTLPSEAQPQSRRREPSLAGRFCAPRSSHRPSLLRLP